MSATDNPFMQNPVGMRGTSQSETQLRSPPANAPATTTQEEDEKEVQQSEPFAVPQVARLVRSEETFRGVTWAERAKQKVVVARAEPAHAMTQETITSERTGNSTALARAPPTASTSPAKATSTDVNDKEEKQPEPSLAPQVGVRS